MFEHEGCRAIGVVRLDGVGDVAVLVVRARWTVRRVVQNDHEASQRFELAHGARKKRIARRFGNDLVKLARQPNDRAFVSRGSRRRLERNVLAQPCDLRRGRRARHALNKARFDQAARLEYLTGFLHGRAADERTAIGNDRDDAVMREPRQGLPNFGPADAEDARQPLFDQLGAGRQLMLKDGA